MVHALLAEATSQRKKLFCIYWQTINFAESAKFCFLEQIWKKLKMSKKNYKNTKKRITIRQNPSEEALKTIAKKCNNKTVLASINYLRRLKFNGTKLIIEVINDVAFYIVSVNKTHLRVIQVAVAEKERNKGYGSLCVMRIKQHCLKLGKDKLTLKTEKGTYASDWWSRTFKTVITKETSDGYEMEIRL